jgi:hypothetical protein
MKGKKLIAGENSGISTKTCVCEVNQFAVKSGRESSRNEKGVFARNSRYLPLFI